MSNERQTMSGEKQIIDRILGQLGLTDEKFESYEHALHEISNRIATLKCAIDICKKAFGDKR